MSEKVNIVDLELKGIPQYKFNPATWLTVAVADAELDANRLVSPEESESTYRELQEIINRGEDNLTSICLYNLLEKLYLWSTKLDPLIQAGAKESKSNNARRNVLKRATHDPRNYESFKADYLNIVQLTLNNLPSRRDAIETLLLNNELKYQVTEDVLLRWASRAEREEGIKRKAGRPKGARTKIKR